MRRLIALTSILLMAALGACAHTQAVGDAPGDVAMPSPGTQPAGALPHIAVDVKARQVRVDCQMLGVQVPLEFFCVADGTNEHESVLRSPAKPSNIHLALLMLGLEPGEPVKFSEATKTWRPPHGPPLSITVEFTKDGKLERLPAARLMRSVKTKEPMQPHPYIFAGSQIAPDGTYAADVTGYIVSIVNFDLSLIDVPELASNANETLEWEINKEAAPPKGTAVTMIIEPMDHADAPAPATKPAGPFEEQPAQVAADQHRIAQLRQRWQDAVAPHQQDLRNAAQAHYEVIAQLRREQQRLIDEADRIQRLIDELEKKYQEMTTPQPTAQPAPTPSPQAENDGEK